MIEGTVLKASGLPMLTNDTLLTAVREAYSHGKLAIAHTLTAAATEQAIAAGMDGLAHVFLDQPHTPDLITTIANSGTFVTPCLVLNSSIMGHAPSAFVSDARVSSKLSPDWMSTLSSSFNAFLEGNFPCVLATVAALHKAGVDILVGTDASVPQPHLGGLAHGVSVHHEMQMLVGAGLTPVETLKAATSVPARRFGLSDRGRIAAALRADLLLVEGDPTVDIGDSRSIRKVWRRGRELDTQGGSSDLSWEVVSGII
jgi:imidazolonepropionase-like amidohydrolase